MSLAVSNLVWKSRRHVGTDRFVLVALANYASDEGVAWPSVAILASDLALSTRQVQRALARLETDGTVAIERGTGRGHASIYTINLDALATGKKDDIATSRIRAGLSTQKGDISDEKGDITVSPITGTERVTSQTIKGDISDERVTSRALKGDIAMSPQRKEPSLRTVKDPSDTARAAPRAPTPAYRLYQVMCESLGASELDATKGDRDKQLSIAQRLVSDGVTEEEVRACIGYLRSQDWRTGLVNLATVSGAISDWRRAGRPATAVPPAKSRASPRTANHSDMFKAIARGEVA